MLDNDPETPDYPSDWTASLTQARGDAPFPILLPDEPEANSSNLVEVFVRPVKDPKETGVALIFPIAEQPQKPVRQEYIGVFIEAWTGGDPRTDYLDYLAKAKAAGHADEYTEVRGHPAIIVPAHAESDVDQANPAFLTTVVSGIELQVYGGESLETVQRVAEDLIDRYEKTVP